MSDPGLHTYLYTQLRNYAELVDDVIVDLETAGGKRETERRQTLSELLRALDTEPVSDLSATLLWNILRENKLPRKADWSKVADAIERGDTFGEVIERLEELARVLELERAEMNARMHGPNVT